MAEEKSNIQNHLNSGNSGMNLDRSVNQIPKGQLSYALNASLENFDANSISYQNEPGNEICLQFPKGYQLIGSHAIIEQGKHIFFLANPTTGDSEIGYMDNNDCTYKTFINAPCLNFNINHPIHKAVHKITNCSTEVYWPDQNGRRYIDLNNPPYRTEDVLGQCEPRETLEIDCNKIKVQPDFYVPTLEVKKVISGGNLISGTVQFAVQYCSVAGDAYTSYFSVTNPLPISNPKVTTPEFNSPVGKSVVVTVSNLDTTGYYSYFNIAVIKTVNNIPSVELIGTFTIDGPTKEITYNGQNQTQVRLTINDIFEKYPTYEIAEDITAVQDILVWKGLTSVDRINYQHIANQITLQWESWRIPATENYADELNAANLRSALRDEVYPYEIAFLLNNGKQTDGFHIPGRKITPYDLSLGTVSESDPDFIGEPDESGTSPYWKVYNTARVSGTDSKVTSSPDYKGPYQYGEFAYWESTETYPCNEDLWGELSGQPIRHHKFPDVLVSPIFESSLFTTAESMVMENNAVFPIGVKINVSQIEGLIKSSNLTPEQKEAIIGFKILRGNRDVNKSIVAKGVLRNVGKYTREGTDYYFPNYPYNDLKEDPFLLEASNAFMAECITFRITATSDMTYEYTDCLTNSVSTGNLDNGEIIEICSLSTPIPTKGTATIIVLDYDTYTVRFTGDSGFAIVTYNFYETNADASQAISENNSEITLKVTVDTVPFVSYTFGDGGVSITKAPDSQSVPFCYPNNLQAFTSDESKYRQVFNSPETSFGQPFLGDILKLENVIYGAGKAHFVEVKKNALYKLLTKEAQQDALSSAANIANITTPFNPTAMFTAYQSYLQIYLNGITRKNYGWSYNSILDYSYHSPIENGLGIKQRKIDNIQYLIPGVQSVNESININNYQRESSVYLKTTEQTTALPFPSETPSLLQGGNPIVEDSSRFINSQKNCSQPEEQFDINSVVYYASIKNYIPNQWGQIYSYETIDTGTQVLLKDNLSSVTAFGGDTFISKFSFKTKLPFFIDNRVGAPDDSDIFYDEIGNVAYPAYWHSSRSILYDYQDAIVTTPLKNIISVKARNFDCPNNQEPAPSPGPPEIFNPNRTFYDGKIYMFAYGIPSFYVESSVNVDLRQAFNSKEGDFYPHVSDNIPDDWVQESNVSIAQDNTYYYNVTYSKQNKENFFSHLPENWREELCYTFFPFSAIYSDPQKSFVDNRVNNWLIYRPQNKFDFPQNYGKFTSIDGIDNKQVLTRFENKSLLYNALYTTQTNTQGQVYLGQALFSAQVPPLDFAETDLGYVGSQHKFLLKIPQGQISVDAKRGQIFLLKGNSAQDLSAPGSGVNRFLTDHLAFEIVKYFPNIDIDNHFKGIGLHGVFDSKFERIIISKLDYVPLSSDIKYDYTTQEFYVEKIIGDYTVKEIILLSDSEYFCNKSWTLSFNLITNSWISFHSYIPNWYIAENNFFYSGLNESCDLEAIAAEIIPSTTTTTTTTLTPDCELVGDVDVLNCTLEGTALPID